MIDAEIAAEIVGLVPHWYRAECGPEKYSIKIGQHREFFYNHRKLTPRLEEFLTIVQRRMKDIQLNYFDVFPGLVDVLLESLVLEWLRLHSQRTNWTKLMKYLEELSSRTFENQPVALNLILRQGQGEGDITQTHLQKVFDQLASSPLSFLVVDPDLRFIDYGEVSWSRVTGELSHKFYPELLHPIHCVLEDEDLSAHLTSQGDLIFMNKDGLLAARRKRKWKIYDVRTFKNGLAQCMGKATVGANLFEIVFDLSFARYGSLLIYDPRHQLRDRLLNRQCIVFPGWKDDGKTNGNGNGNSNGNGSVNGNGNGHAANGVLVCAASSNGHAVNGNGSSNGHLADGNGRAASGKPSGNGSPVASIACQDLIARSVMDLGLGEGVAALKRKRRLIELARVDGAVIFDDQHLLAVGAIIKSHPDVGSQLGARTTAAKSAYLWGAHPVKVSSDGDVTIYFKSRKGSESCDAVMHFL